MHSGPLRTARQSLPDLANLAKKRGRLPPCCVCLCPCRAGGWIAGLGLGFGLGLGWFVFVSEERNITDLTGVGKIDGAIDEGAPPCMKWNAGVSFKIFFHFMTQDDFSQG